MNTWVKDEICVGFTSRVVGFGRYLELATTKVIYNAPFEIYCWFWFLAYILNFKDRHNKEFFKLIPTSLLFQTLRSNYGKFVDIVENFCDAFFKTIVQGGVQHRERIPFDYKNGSVV